MTVDSVERQYNLSREAASKLLKVSIRTLDRYIKAKKMSTVVVDGRIWLKKDEIDGFLRTKVEEKHVDSVRVSTGDLSSSDYVDRVDKIDNIEFVKQDNVESLSTKQRPPSGNSETFKKLYEELKEEVKEKQERLEIANYRVGQLENQVRNSIPMLEYHRENYEKKRLEEDLKIKLDESAGIIKMLGSKLKYAKFSKRLYIAISLIILALQPLWLLLISSAE